MAVKDLKPVPFKPLADWVLVEPIPRGQTAGGIALPEQTNSDEPQKGRIVKVGPGRYDSGVFIEPEIQEGDVVWLAFAYQQPIQMSIGGKKHLVVRSRDCIATVPE